MLTAPKPVPHKCFGRVAVDLPVGGFQLDFKTRLREQVLLGKRAERPVEDAASAAADPEDPPCKKRDIFGEVIAKWSALAAGADEHEDVPGGGLSSLSSEDDDDSDDYDHEDDLIDNSELQLKFTVRARAQHKHKRLQAGFQCVGSNDGQEREGSDEEVHPLSASPCVSLLPASPDTAT